ncbi:hypothetical protein DSL72_003441 [Monilinia vaccinii-corymbosi]|uniref:Uncharacterized protein n=1 Tax=Monilinia vaccinii-corymbosi TaxID=61207 RepID=A0A8A3NZP9_9HELO|nr:hypothetical protein DSL72_003441 [Monilinia vaccinii-corymbosi]
MQTVSTVNIPSYQAPKTITPASSSSHQVIEVKDHLRKNLSRAEATIKQRRNFGPDLKALERRTQGLFMDQASLNFNLLNRFQTLDYSPQTSSSPLKPPNTLLEQHPSVPGPLQHPHSHLEQSGLANLVFEMIDEDVEMNGATDIEIIESSIVSEKAQDPNDNEDEVPTTPYSTNATQYSTPVVTIEGPLHPGLLTTAISTPEQIELELSFLMVEKHNELRLIHTELANAQIMLEQLRRAHIKPFFLTTNERGEVYMKRLVLRKFSAEEKKRKREREELRKVEEEERRRGGKGMELRSKYIKR